MGWLLSQAWPAIFYRPYRRVTAVLTLLVGVAVWAVQQSLWEKLLVVGVCAGASVASALAALSVGTVWRMNVVPGEQRRDPPRLPLFLLNSMIVAYGIALPVVIAAVPGCWCVALPGWLLGGWFAFWSWFVAGMAVSGDWI